MADGTCVLDGCEAGAFSRRLCRPHYMRVHKAGELDSYPVVRRPARGQCSECDREFNPHRATQRYCSVDCRKQADAERARRRYREGAWANAPHGSSGRYAKGGCRCDLCRTEANRRKREQYARRVANGGSREPGSIENTCRLCGAQFYTKPKPNRKRSYCQRACYLAAVGTTPDHDWWVNRGQRLAIYDRDGWRCQLCGDPVDMCAPATDSASPTLDHIVPRARGGTDDPDNLRLAHRGCNCARGSAVDEYIDELAKNPAIA